MKKIYIFGNPILDYDNLPIKFIPELKKTFPEIEFIEIDPNENLKPENGKLVIIDTIAGIEEVIAIKDIDKIDKIESNPNVSMHDFDLGFNLKLLKKIGILKEIVIFGIPQNKEKQAVLEQLVQIIKEQMENQGPSSTSNLI